VITANSHKNHVCITGVIITSFTLVVIELRARLALPNKTDALQSKLHGIALVSERKTLP
jgi:hypothetical protein